MTSLHKEWKDIYNFLDKESPFYPGTEVIFKNFQLSHLNFDHIINHSNFSEETTEGEALDLNLFSYYQLINLSTFIRLIDESIFNSHLKNASSKKKLKSAKEQIMKVYENVFEEVNKRVDFSTFEEIDLNTLVKVQLGSGLIVLNNMLNEKC